MVFNVRLLLSQKQIGMTYRTLDVSIGVEKAFFLGGGNVLLGSFLKLVTEKKRLFSFLCIIYRRWSMKIS